MIKKKRQPIRLPLRLLNPMECQLPRDKADDQANTQKESCIPEPGILLGEESYRHKMDGKESEGDPENLRRPRHHKIQHLSFSHGEERM